MRRETGAGTGRLSITCKGCGEAITYKAAEAGELAAGPNLTNGDSGHMEIAPPEGDGLRKIATPAPREPKRSTDRSRLLPAILIGLLILTGALMITVGLVRSGGDGRSDDETAAPATQPTTSETTPAETAPQATETEPPAQTTPAPAPSTPPVRLKRRDFEGRFAMGVPVGWKAGSDEGAILIAPGGSTAAIRVFFEPGADRASDLAEGATRFLADEHDGADVSGPQPIKLGDEKGQRINATYSSGEESAVVLSAGGYTFLVLLRVDNGASETVAAEGEAALASFRAKN